MHRPCVAAEFPETSSGPPKLSPALGVGGPSRSEHRRIWLPVGAPTMLQIPAVVMCPHSATDFSGIFSESYLGTAPGPGCALSLSWPHQVGLSCMLPVPCSFSVVRCPAPFRCATRQVKNTPARTPRRRADKSARRGALQLAPAGRRARRGEDLDLGSRASEGRGPQPISMAAFKHIGGTAVALALTKVS